MEFMRMPWYRLVIRAFSIANFFLSGLGLYAAVTVLAVYLEGRRSFGVKPPCMTEAYYAMTGVNLLFLVALIPIGVYLWRFRHRGLITSNILFASEILYDFGTVYFSLVLPNLGGRISAVGECLAAAGGIGNIGIAPQTTIAYPIVGLIVLNIAYHRLAKESEVATVNCCEN